MSINGIAVYCRSVSKTYLTGSTKVLALRGVDLEVRVGRVAHAGGSLGVRQDDPHFRDCRYS